MKLEKGKQKAEIVVRVTMHLDITEDDYPFFDDDVFEEGGCTVDRDEFIWDNFCQAIASTERNESSFSEHFEDWGLEVNKVEADA